MSIDGVSLVQYLINISLNRMSKMTTISYKIYVRLSAPITVIICIAFRITCGRRISEIADDNDKGYSAKQQLKCQCLYGPHPI